MDDSFSDKFRPPMKPWIPLAMLGIGQSILLWLVVICPVELFGNAANGRFILTGLQLGICLAHATIAAAWLVWGRFALPKRVLWGLFSVILAGTALVNARNFQAKEDFLGGLLLFGAILAQSIFIGGMLKAALVYGIELVFPANYSSDSPQRHNQFNLRDLLILTTCIAVTLGIGRQFWPHKLDLTFEKRQWELLTELILLFLGNLFLGNAVVTCFHVRRKWWVNTLLVLLIGTSLACIQAFAINRIEGNPTAEMSIWLESKQTYKMFIWINCCHAGWLIANLWVLHSLGFQMALVRHWSHKISANNKQSPQKSLVKSNN